MELVASLAGGCVQYAQNNHQAEKHSGMVGMSLNGAPFQVRAHNQTCKEGQSSYG